MLSATDIGERLKQARLNLDLTQVEVAERAGVTRKAVLNAEKGKATLDVFVAIMHGLGLGSQLNNFMPPAPVSPVQLAKLQGKKRQRASGSRIDASETDTEDGGQPTW